MIIDGEVPDDRRDLARARGRWAEGWAAETLEREGYAIWWINRPCETGSDVDIKIDAYLYDVKSANRNESVVNVGDHEPSHPLLVVAGDYTATIKAEWWLTARIIGVAPRGVAHDSDDVPGWKRCWHVHLRDLIPLLPPNLPLFPDVDLSHSETGSREGLFLDAEIDVGSQVLLDKRTANPSRKTYGPGPDGATCGQCVHLSTAYEGKQRRCDIPIAHNQYGQHYAGWLACAKFESSATP